MIPILYNETETAFTSNGVGRLSEAISCVVTEERNGEFELEMEYPVSGKYYSEIRKSRIIFAVPADGKTGQAFRIYKITKPIGGIITINAEHISYQLSLIPVTPFTADSSNTARLGIWSHAVGTNPFDHWSDFNSTANYSVETPKSLRACLGGSRGSFLDVYGGEFEWDNWHVKIHAQRGMDRGVTIRYGKNLTDFEQEENIQDVITGILPYWYNEDDKTLVMLDEKVVMSSYANNYPFNRVLPIDLTDNFSNQPTQEQLRTAARSYITSNKIGIPKISIEISFVPLYQTEEYKNIAVVERVNLCDTVSVYFEKLNISATAKVIKTEYNVLLDRYDKIQLGDARSSFGDTIIKQEQKAEEIEVTVAQKAAFLRRAISEATQLITGGLGGYVVIEPNPDTGYPEEILIMDNPDKEQAVNCIRINKNGIGFSKNGYEPPNFDTAWTIDGKFNADYIAAGQIDTTLLKTGTISDHDGNTTYDLDTGELKSKKLVIDTKTDGGSLEIKSENFTVTPSGEVTLVKANLERAIAKYSLQVKYNANPSLDTVSTFMTNMGLTIGSVGTSSVLYKNPFGLDISYGYKNSHDVWGEDNPDIVAAFGQVGNGLVFSGNGQHMLFLNNGANPNGISEKIIMYGDICLVTGVPSVGDFRKITIKHETTDQNKAAIVLGGTLIIDGDMWCDSGGQKLRAVDTKHYGKVGLSAMESPEPVFSDFGGGVTDSEGRCYVQFDKVFCETVDLSKDYRVFCTETSPGKIDFIEKRPDCFVVHGEPSTSFDWIVYAKQIDYSDTRFLRMD